VYFSDAATGSAASAPAAGPSLKKSAISNKNRINVAYVNLRIQNGARQQSIKKKKSALDQAGSLLLFTPHFTTHSPCDY
jgi:hypothetical protein